jgi:hypothetical protein
MSAIKYLLKLGLTALILLITTNATPANALTLRIGSFSNTTFTGTRINDNGTGDASSSLLNTITFNTRFDNFDVAGTLVANEDPFTGYVVLNLTRFSLRNISTTARVSPTIRFEHAFSIPFLANSLSGIQVFDGTFTAPTGSALRTTTSAQVRTFFTSADPNWTPSFNSITATANNISASRTTPAIPTGQTRFDFKIGVSLPTTNVTGLKAVGEVQALSLGAGETLSLPNSACTVIASKNYYSEDEQGHNSGNPAIPATPANPNGPSNPATPAIPATPANPSNENDEKKVFNEEEARRICDSLQTPEPPTEPTSIPETSGGLSVIVSGILGAGYLMMRRQSKTLA